jgi:hypothetical protein
MWLHYPVGGYERMVFRRHDCKRRYQVSPGEHRHLFLFLTFAEDPCDSDFGWCSEFQFLPFCFLNLVSLLAA